jgi:hypothetical protein
MRAYVGRRIPCSHAAFQPDGRVCDPHGHQLGLASLPIADFTPCHEGCAAAIFDMVGSITRVDREPAHAFHAVVPPDMLRPGPFGNRPGIITDGAAYLSMTAAVTARGARQPRRAEDPRWMHFDVKTIHAGGPNYTSARARHDQCGAVADRAHQVQPQYERHARALDRRIADAHGTPLGTAVFDHLRSLTQVRALVVGNYAEASSDVHQLVSIVAGELAQRRWRRMGARTQAEARGFFIASLRRSLCVVFAREMARHRLRRIPFIGVPREAIRARPPYRAQHEPQYLPQMAQLADFMRLQAHALPVMAAA